jgi:hypothetical protein
MYRVKLKQRCLCCERELKDEESIQRGYGPVCWDKIVPKCTRCDAPVETWTSKDDAAPKGSLRFRVWMGIGNIPNPNTNSFGRWYSDCCHARVTNEITITEFGGRGKHYRTYDLRYGWSGYLD